MKLSKSEARKMARFLNPRKLKVDPIRKTEGNCYCFVCKEIVACSLTIKDRYVTEARCLGCGKVSR